MTEPGPDGREADLDATDSQPDEITPRSRNTDVEREKNTSGMEKD